MGREDAGVKLDVSRLIHTMDVSERSGDAEIGGDGPQGLLYSPDLSPKTAQRNDQGLFEADGKKRQDTFRRCAIVAPGAH